MLFQLFYYKLQIKIHDKIKILKIDNRSKSHHFTFYFQSKIYVNIRT